MTRRFIAHSPKAGHAGAPRPSRAPADKASPSSPTPSSSPAREIGGPEGPEPTRYGDWERNGICTDF